LTVAPKLVQVQIQVPADFWSAVLSCSTWNISPDEAQGFGLERDHCSLHLDVQVDFGTKAAGCSTWNIGLDPGGVGRRGSKPPRLTCRNRSGAERPRPPRDAHPQDLGTTGPRNFEDAEPRDFGTPGPRNSGTSAAVGAVQNHRALLWSPRKTPGLRNQGTSEPRRCGTTGPRDSGTSQC